MADQRKLHRVIKELKDRLVEATTNDPDQEVQDIALPVLDRIIGDCRELLGEGDPVADSVSGVITAERLGAGVPLRAFDAMLVVSALEAALRPGASIASPARARLDDPRRLRRKNL